MPHTRSRFQQDLGFTDGVFWVPAANANVVPAAFVLTRNAASDISGNVAASQNVTVPFCMSDGQLLRTGFGEDLMEQFGGTGISASADPQVSRPDVMPSMNAGQQLQPRTALKVKGFKFLSMKVVYSITGAALTSQSVRVDQTVYANNVANAITSILANGANGLQTATQANPYVTVINFAANQQIYRVVDLSSIYVEFNIVTPVSAAYRLYGFEVTVEFNLN